MLVPAVTFKKKEKKISKTVLLETPPKDTSHHAQILSLNFCVKYTKHSYLSAQFEILWH